MTFDLRWVYIKCTMFSKSSKMELGFVHYIAKFTILRFVISRFECTTADFLQILVLHLPTRISKSAPNNPSYWPSWYTEVFWDMLIGLPTSISANSHQKPQVIFKIVLKSLQFSDLWLILRNLVKISLERIKNK